MSLSDPIISPTAFLFSQSWYRDNRISIKVPGISSDRFHAKMSLSLALAVQAIEKKYAQERHSGAYVAEKRAVVKFIVVVVALRGNERARPRISPLLVDCQNSRSLCHFYSRSLSRSLRAWNPSSSGDSGLFPGDFFFFKKSRTRSSVRTDGVFRIVGALEDPGDTWRANDCAPEKDFYPTGGGEGGRPTWWWFLVGVCAHPVPWNPAKRGSPITFSRAQKGKCAAALMAEKRLGFLTRGSGYRRSRCIHFRECRSLHNSWNSYFESHWKTHELLFIHIYYLHYTCICHLYIYLFIYFPRIYSLVFGIFIHSCSREILRWHLFIVKNSFKNSTSFHRENA